MTIQSVKSISDGQRQHLKYLVFNAIDKALAEFNLEKHSAQRIIENPTEFQLYLKELIHKYSVTNQFADEEVRSNYTYPTEYKGPKPINDQIKVIAEIFGLDLSHEFEFAKTLPELPMGAEGWFAIPTVDAVASKYFPDITDTALRYCRAVELVLELIGKSRKFCNYLDGYITPDRLRQHPRTLNALNKLSQIQKNSQILIFPAQYGKLHGGRSVRRARECFVGDEFGLGAFAVGCMALVHPERYVRWEELDTECAGDEFAPVADGDFSRAPIFRFFGGRVWFDSGLFDSAYGGYGSVSAFLQQ